MLREVPTVWAGYRTVGLQTNYNSLCFFIHVLLLFRPPELRRLFLRIQFKLALILCMISLFGIGCAKDIMECKIILTALLLL